MAESATQNGSNLRELTIATAVVSMVLCTTGVAARLFTRLKDANQNLLLEDWILVGPAYICTMGVACTMIIATTYKLGSHVDRVKDIDDIVKLMKTVYALQIALLIALGAIRASLLLFIKRLSKTSSRPIYVITSALVHISTIHITVSIFSSVFRCNPIDTPWTPGTIKYTCTNIAAVYLLVTVGLAIDALMFVLPAILIVSLHITKKKKLQSLVMFALGGGGCIIEALRFGQLQEAKISPDPTYIDATISHEARNAKYLRDNLESGQDSLSRESSRSLPSQFTRSPIADNIEMGIQGSGAVHLHNDKDGPKVVERIMDLKEVLKFCDEERGSLAAPQVNEASGASRSDSSQTYEEFHAKPIEWGRQL
ncbi:hypothetical protein TWF281_011096 [Arthrobotrys megalospora]